MQPNHESCGVGIGYRNVLDSGFRPLLSAVNFKGHYEGLGELKTVATGSSFSGATEIHVTQGRNSAHCGGPNLNSFYTVTYSNGTTQSFYLVVRYIKMNEHTTGRWCEGWEDHKSGLLQRFDEESRLSSDDLGNGQTLIRASGVKKVVGDVLLLVNGLPHAVWSSNRNVFVIPMPLLKPELDKADDDWGRRYKALLEVIHETPE